MTPPPIETSTPQERREWIRKDMKLNKRKLKFAASFFVCWFALWVLIVDGIIGFQTLLDKVGSYAILEISLILIVIIPTAIVYMQTKEKK